MKRLTFGVVGGGRVVRFGNGRLQVRGGRKVPFAPVGYMSWRDLVGFVDLMEWPNLEALRIEIGEGVVGQRKGKIPLVEEQVGGLLKGEFDEVILGWVYGVLPGVAAGDEGGIVCERTGKNVKVEVSGRHDLDVWVSNWMGEMDARALDKIERTSVVSSSFSSSHFVPTLSHSRWDNRSTTSGQVRSGWKLCLFADIVYIDSALNSRDQVRRAYR